MALYVLSGDFPSIRLIFVFSLLPFPLCTSSGVIRELLTSFNLALCGRRGPKALLSTPSSLTERVPLFIMAGDAGDGDELALL